MELFSEIYSCYFTAIRKILEKSQKSNLTYNEIAEIINENAYADSAFYIMPFLISYDWNLLIKDEKGFSSKIGSEKLNIPVTVLQKSWLKALIFDKRLKLFLDACEIEKLYFLLKDVDTMYEVNDFHVFDAAADGDCYEDEQYIKNFRVILSAIKSKSVLQIDYDSGKCKPSRCAYLPLKINYSGKDDKFRLIAAHLKKSRTCKSILNISRIKNINILSEFEISDVRFENILTKPTCKEPVILKIFQGRNALERVLLQFASMDKQTEFDEETNSYTCKIFYDESDETEILIRILSFGPVVKVLGPEHFIEQIKDRIHRQVDLIW